MGIEKIILRIREEIQAYSHKQRLFFFFAMLCGFFITAEYAITKPASNSIFLAHYTVKLYPYAWLLTVPLNLLVVACYNHFLKKLGYFKMFLCTVFAVVGVNLFVGAFVQKFPPLAFFLYMWKDIYVLLMFQQLWSVIHLKAEISQAKYLYGILFGISGIGAVIGSLVPSFFAVTVGSERLLYLTLPLYLFFILAYYQMLQKGGVEGAIKLRVKETKGGFKLIHSSPTLKFILLIVILMQLSTTIMDYQFNSFLQQKFPIQDLRTEFYGRLWGLINICKLCLQFFATFLLVQFLGMRKSHFIVPIVLLGNAIFILIAPSFGLIAYGFGMIKTFDYSIFNILKEMLYVPLRAEEKFKAKAVIDVFAYRSAKAFASIFVLAVGFLSPSRLPYAYSWGPFLLFIVWVGAVFTYFYGKRQKPLEA